MSGRHRKSSRGGIGVAALATSGAFAIVPMVMATGTANAADAPAPNPNPAPAPQQAAPPPGNAAPAAARPAPAAPAPGARPAVAPAPAPAAPAPAAPAPAAPAPAASAPSAPAPAAPAMYTVKPGDTLSSIAAGRGTNWHALWTANKTAVPDANLLHPGEQLQMPTGAIHAAPALARTSADTGPAKAAPATLPMAGQAPAAAPSPAHNAPAEAPVNKAPAKAAASAPKKITAAAKPAIKPGGAIDTPPSGAAKQMKIWLTGYSFQDNTPAGSATVSHPILHKDAGGTGTYADPITVAVPGKGSGIWKAGSRFYLPSVKRYVIVEDTGASPAPSGTAGHLDMWVDGEGGSKAQSDKCMDQITSQSAAAIFNPAPNLPVMPGPITKNGKCNIPT